MTTNLESFVTIAQMEANAQTLVPRLPSTPARFGSRPGCRRVVTTPDIDVKLQQSQEWMNARFADVFPDDFDRRVIFYTALPLEAPTGFTGMWGTLKKDGQQLSREEREAFANAPVVVLFADMCDDAQMQSVVEMTHLINTTLRHAAPVIILGMHSVHPTSRNSVDNDAMFSSLSRAIDDGIDDVIAEELDGMRLAWEVKNRTSVQAHLTQKLTDLSEEQERTAQVLQDSINHTMWTYLRIRLGTQLPPLDHNIAEPLQIVNKLKVGHLLGEGSFGKVYQLVSIDNTPSGSVLKAVSKNKIRGIEGLVRMREQMQVMEFLSEKFPHPNVTKLVATFHSASYLLFQLEDGGPLNLYKYLKLREGGRASLPMSKAQDVILQMMSAVCHLHTKAKVVHLDLKPENIIVAYTKREVVIKISDFDSAKVNPEFPMCELVGTFPFAAPEVIRRRKYDPYAADVWSLGVVILEVVCGPEILEKSLGLGKQKAANKEHRSVKQDAAQVWHYISQPNAVENMLEGSIRCELQLMMTVASLILGGMLKLEAAERVNAEQMMMVMERLESTTEKIQSVLPNIICTRGAVRPTWSPSKPL
jgi:hypothetical protein